MTEIERVADERCIVGEGPLWHPEQERLYWVDIPSGHLYRFDPATGDHERVLAIDRALAGFTIQDDGSLLLFEGGGAIERWVDGEGIVGTLHSHLPGERGTRFNDVIADPAGRVFAGTMPTDDRQGRLYRIDRDGTATIVERNLTIPNGMGFTKDRETFYCTSSLDREIYAYDYDAATGELGDREVFVDTSGQEGVPDGLTVDEEGFVWSARWDGGAVYRYAPDGTADTRIDLPPPKVSSVTFAAPDDRERLYVTTAVGEGAEADEHSAAGSLYRTSVDVAGRPEHRSRVDASR